ncbi:MAG: ribosome silencing factor [Betaproteobacteria bacterium]|nr:ribosome silencing factor [Betaproteobacteria bacterium]
MKPEETKQLTIEALEDVKGRDIVVLDTRRLSSLFDCMIIASADSSRQARAMSRRVQERVKARGAAILGVEGEQDGDWVLVDLGSVIVHIMHPATRAYYNLEELWGPQFLHSARRQAASS